MVKDLHTLILLLFLAVIQSVTAQEKYEREYGIAPSEVPDAAIHFVAQITSSRKVNWYKEESLSTFSYEAKTKIKGQRFSIEFDTSGILEDVEIIVKARDIEENTLHKIKKHLEQETDQYKIEKIQQQYSGDTTLLINYFNNAKAEPKGILCQYEIIVKTKINTQFFKYEYTFSSEGIFEKKRKIILRNTDNLEY